MRIKHNGVRALDTIPEMTHLRQNHCAAGHRCIDVQPASIFLREVCEPFYVVHCGSRRGAGTRDNGAGLPIVGYIIVKLSTQISEIYCKFIGNRTRTQLIFTKACQQRRFCGGCCVVKVQTSCRIACVAILKMRVGWNNSLLSRLIGILLLRWRCKHCVWCIDLLR